MSWTAPDYNDVASPEAKTSTVELWGTLAPNADAAAAEDPAEPKHEVEHTSMEQLPSQDPLVSPPVPGDEGHAAMEDVLFKELTVSPMESDDEDHVAIEHVSSHEPLVLRAVPTSNFSEQNKHPENEESPVVKNEGKIQSAEALERSNELDLEDLKAEYEEEVAAMRIEEELRAEERQAERRDIGL